MYQMILCFILFVITLFLHPYVEPPQALSYEVKRDLWLTFVLMFVHKVESYATVEWDVCPLYTYLAYRLEKGKGFFLIFCGTFLVMAMFMMMVITDPSWRFFLPLAWGGQLLNEVHHVSKAFAFKRYYSGAVTALMMVLYACFVFFPNFLSVWDMEHYGKAPYIVALASFYVFYKEVEPPAQKEKATKGE